MLVRSGGPGFARGWLPSVQGKRWQGVHCGGHVQHPRVAYVNTAKALVVASLAFRHRATPMVYHLRDIVTSSHLSRANRWALVTLANCYAARVIANSQATADAFVAAGGKRQLVTVIPNGFDPEPFDRAIEQRKADVENRRLAAVRTNGDATVATYATESKPAANGSHSRYSRRASLRSLSGSESMNTLIRSITSELPSIRSANLPACPSEYSSADRASIDACVSCG